MTIGIDLRCLPRSGDPGAGVAHAAREMSMVMVGQGARHAWNLYVPHDAEDLGIRADAARRVRLVTTTGSVLRESLRRVPCDILFVPSGAVAPALPVPCVPWVHDLAIYEHPEWFPQPFFRRMLTKRLYRQGVVRAPVVLTVSDATRQDVVSRFGVPEARVRVTHEGGDPILADLAGVALHQAKQRARHRLADRGITQPFILQLGTLEPRKNVPTLLVAWREARSRFTRPVDLVIAGADGWKLGSITRALDHERSYPGEDGARLHRVDAVDDDDRRDLLLAAELVAIPSFHEGFGLVALEAMQAGTAVIASDAGALPEVVGGGGPTLPAKDVQAWARALADLMSDDGSRTHLAEQGKARSQGMSWKRAADVALHALTDALH